MQIFDCYALIDLMPYLEPFIGKKELPILDFEIHNYYLSSE